MAMWRDGTVDRVSYTYPMYHDLCDFPLSECAPDTLMLEYMVAVAPPPSNVAELASPGDSSSEVMVTERSCRKRERGTVVGMIIVLIVAIAIGSVFSPAIFMAVFAR